MEHSKWDLIMILPIKHKGVEFRRDKANKLQSANDSISKVLFFFLYSDGMLATADQNNYSNHLLSLFKTSQQLSQL